jgi:hypothetical protein
MTQSRWMNNFDLNAQHSTQRMIRQGAKGGSLSVEQYYFRIKYGGQIRIHLRKMGEIWFILIDQQAN